MDEIDKKIILLLQEDARMTITDMTEHLNLSRPSITERLKRLHDAGIIEKYTARISPEAVGKSIQAFLRIESLKSLVNISKKLFMKNSKFSNATA